MVRIRLARRGRKKLALYDVVVANSKSPRDGRFIEKLGTYNPQSNPAEIVLNLERAVYWLMVGAQPSDTARMVLSREGAMFKKHLQVGVNKGAISQEVADKRFDDWKSAKVSKVAAKKEELVKAKSSAKSSLEAQLAKKAKEAADAKAKAKLAAAAEAPAEVENTEN